MSDSSKAPASQRADQHGVGAQNKQNLNFHDKVSASLLRRLAEAADGHRGKDVWFVFSTDDEDLPKGKRGRYVSGAHQNTAAADRETGPAKPQRHRIGPFFTETWANSREHKVVHLSVTTRNLRNPEEDPRAEGLDARKLDSLFWTEAVIDKFVIPYYVGLYGMEYGEQIKKEFDKADVYALTHLPGSEYVAKVVKPEEKGMGLLVEEIIPEVDSWRR
jgi:hypothetical protein